MSELEQLLIKMFMCIEGDELEEYVRLREEALKLVKERKEEVIFLH